MDELFKRIFRNKTFVFYQKKQNLMFKTDFSVSNLD